MQIAEEIDASHVASDLRFLELPLKPPRDIGYARIAILALALLSGLSARLYHLDAAGLSEDEVHKVFAVRAYDHGDFTVNAEHPMLLKTLSFASLHLTEAWNSLLSSAKPTLAISQETALRVPCALLGALTVIPLFLLAEALLGFRIASIAAMLWALGLNSIWFNRIAKEDTLLVFFIYTGYYLYDLAKNRPASDTSGQERLYALAGIAFGLMLASKYFPHYYGVLPLFYHVAGYNPRNNRPIPRRCLSYLFGAMLITFAIFNFAIFIPQTWRYLSHYLNEDFQTHHGYLMMGRLFLNDMSRTPGGNPWYFYLLYLLVKLPLPVLAALGLGIWRLFQKYQRIPGRTAKTQRTQNLRRGHHSNSHLPRARPNHSSARGYLFLRVMLIFWIVPMSVLGTKFLRYSLALMPLVYITAAVGVAWIWRALEHRLEGQLARKLCAVAVAGVFVGVPSIVSVASLPYPSLYTNPLAGGRTGYFFPHDEFYDLGARESVKYLADHAAYGASVATEAPGVVEYYLERYGRLDIVSEIMSHPDFDLTGRPPDFVLLLPGRTYFENINSSALVQATYPLVQSSVVRNVPVTRLYARELTANMAETPAGTERRPYRAANVRAGLLSR
jgi:hypothetical protein